MAYVNNSADVAMGRSAANIIRRFFARIGETVDFYAEVRSKHDRITYLYSLTDAQLEARGMTRETIPQAVFNSKLGF